MKSVSILLSTSTVLLSISLASCASHTKIHKSALDKERMANLKQRAQLTSIKNHLKNGDFRKAFDGLYSIDYFSLSPEKQRKCEILMKFWEENRNYMSSTRIDWPNQNLILQLNARKIGLEDKDILFLHLELQLRNYATADRLLRSINHDKLKKVERDYCTRCENFLAKVLETEVEDSR